MAAEHGNLDGVRCVYEVCHANIESRDKNGRTPMVNASKEGHLEVVKYLLENCHANMHVKHNRNRSPLELALWNLRHVASAKICFSNLKHVIEYLQKFDQSNSDDGTFD